MTGGAGTGEDRLAAGRAFGRYVVLERLGAGGMGVVLAAYDPELDRRVAIKVLRPEAIAEGSKLIEHTIRLDGRGQRRDLVRERLLAEGRAMARLSHPNLVAVHEVGTSGDEVFLVMEHVAGATLADWCRSQERSWQEIVAAFAQAGRALAAAHDAGLVHGDFKPDNALVEPSGRVRVIDFGLARAAGSRTGEVLAGTPRFLAPELLRGQPADPRADQYAFATALYRELYGTWPVPEPDMSAAPAAPRAPAAPARARGPRQIEQALLRALSPAPEDRHPGMDALLAVLERPRRGTWRVALAAAAGAAIAAGALWGLAGGERGALPSCAEVSASPLAGVWDRPVRARVIAAIEASGRPHAEQTAALAAARIDRWSAAWRRERQDACEATTVRREQSAELMDRRVACLDDLLRRLNATAELLASGGDPALADRAVAMVAALEEPAACDDVDRLWSRPPPPADPTSRAQADAIAAHLARAEAERRGGRLDRSRALAEKALAEATRLGLAALAAEAGTIVALARETRGDAEGAEAELFEALASAARSGEVERSAAAMIDLVRVVGYRQRRIAEAGILRRLAEAELERVDGRARRRLEARLLLAAGDVAYGAGRPREAEPLYRLGLERRRDLLEPGHPAIADAEVRLAVALDDLGRREEARRHHRRALAIREASLGARHPMVADALSNIGRSFEADGDPDQARPYLERALAILAEVPDYNATASVLVALGEVETASGRYERAGQLIDRAIAIHQERAAKDDPALATALYHRGHLGLARGDLAAAMADHERALAIRVARFGPDSPVVALSRSALAEILGRAGRHAAALEQAEAASAALGAALGEDHELVGEPLTYGGLARIALGRPAEAIPALERAAASRGGGPARRAEAAFALARALWLSGRDRPRAVELARTARDDLAASGPRWAALRDEVDAWLARGARRARPAR